MILTLLLAAVTLPPLPDLDGFEAILTDVAFTDGTTIPGPLVITGGDSD